MARTEEDKRQLAAAIRRLEKMRRVEDFDPVRPGSRPNEQQQAIIKDFGKVPIQYIVAGNQSGKTQLASRLITWVITDTHPSWKRPKAWENKSLTIIVACQSGKQIEHSILPKIISYLDDSDYKPVRIGNVVQHLEFTNGNKIVFQSLENPEQARKRLQSYTADGIWLDEQPAIPSIVTESVFRIVANKGFFLATFTPLVVNFEIQRMVEEAALPHSKRYPLDTLANPIYQDPEQRDLILSELSKVSEEERNARLYGKWITPKTLVYQYDSDTMFRDLPEHYSQMWRHVEVVDPALKSKLGLTIWAEDPMNGDWYCVFSEYLQGIYIPSQMLREVQKRTQGFNIVRRVCDPTPWFVGTASEMGLKYTGVYKKVNRKDELLKGLQEKLGSKIYLTSGATSLIQELQTCRWSETAQDKIVNSSSWHLIDCAQYFCDNIPRFDGNRGPVITDVHQYIRQQHQKKQEEKQRQQARIEKDALRKNRGRSSLWKL